jgi:NAD(P)-dependent dehydrogenase (short-subunit alcohol dehydrogenase family)
MQDLNWQQRPYSAERAYGQSKLANLLFTLELQRRLTAAGSPVRAMAAHPGWAATDLQSHSGSRTKNAAMAVGNALLGSSAERGAVPTLYAATADLPGGSYVGPRYGLLGPPVRVSRSKDAKDLDLARRLWTASAQLTGVDFPAALGV